MSTEVKTRIMHVALQMDRDGKILSMSSNSIQEIPAPDGTEPFTKSQSLSCMAENMSTEDKKEAALACEALAGIVLRSQKAPE